VLGVVLLAAAVAQAEDGGKTQRQLCQGKLITFHEVHFRVGKCEFTEGLPAGSAVLKACDNKRGWARGCEVILETDANNVQHVISARVR
jgi:photosystem II stability/assembly factor-like uncharacterized protein